MMGYNDNRGWACSLGAMLSGGCRPPASKSCQPDRNFCPADRNFGNCDCFFSLPAVSRGWHSACRGRVSALLACTDVSRCQGYALSARLHYLIRSIGCTRERPCENPSVFPALSARLHYLCPRFRQKDGDRHTLLYIYRLGRIPRLPFRWKSPEVVCQRRHNVPQPGRHAWPGRLHVL